MRPLQALTLTLILTFSLFAQEREKTEILEKNPVLKILSVAPPLSGFRLDGTSDIITKNKILKPEKGNPPEILIVSFFSIWCEPCKKGIPRLEALSKRFGSDVSVLLVGAFVKKDTEEDFIKFLKDLKTDLPAITDKFGQFAKLWGVEQKGELKLPMTFIVNKNNKIMAILGQEGRDFEEIMLKKVEEARREVEK